MQHGSNKFLKDCLISSPVQLDLSGKSRLSTEQVSDNKILSVFADEKANTSANTDLLPDEIKAEIEYLNNNGMKAGIDYSVTLLDNGDYVLEYLTNYARGFGSIAKRIYHFPFWQLLLCCRKKSRRPDCKKDRKGDSSIFHK